MENLVEYSKPQSAFETAFGANLRRLRKKRNLTIARLAAMMTEVGRPMSEGHLSHLERGTYRSPPSSKDIVAAAYCLNVPPAVLLLPEEAAEIVTAYFHEGWRGVLMLAATKAATPSAGPDG